MHRFTDSPTITDFLFLINTSPICIKMLIDIGCFIYYTQILFQANYYPTQRFPCILRKSSPWFLYNPSIITITIPPTLITQQSLQIITGNFRIPACRLIIQIVYMIPCSTSYYYCIHSMMPMVYTLLTESFLIFKGHCCLKNFFSVFILPMSKTLGFGQSI